MALGEGGLHGLCRQPRPLPAALKDMPRIAIVIGDLGISASGTADAFSKMPGTVSFALSPACAQPMSARKWRSAPAAKTRRALQAPVEPFDYPNNDPGPQTLLTSVSTLKRQ